MVSKQKRSETSPDGGSLVSRWTLGLAMLLVAAACSGGGNLPSTAPSTANTPTTTAPTTTSTPIVILFELGSWHWDSPEQMESVRAEATDIREAESMLILLPTEGPAGGRIISGDLRIAQATPTGQPSASVVVRIELDGSQSTSSVGSHPTDFATSCDERPGGVWTPRAVRGAEGCQLVQPGGPSFLAWQESGSAMWAETSLKLDTLAAWLDTWQPIRPLPG